MRPHSSNNTSVFLRWIPLWLLTAATAVGQFNSLVTNSDGSVLYFSSALSRHGIARPANSPTIFLYRQDTGTFTVPYAINRTAAQNSLTSPDISSDGNVVSFANFVLPCSNDSSCYYGAGNWGYVAVAGGSPSSVSPGFIRLSRNGRYAVSYSEGTIGGLLVYFLDLQEGPRTVTVPGAKMVGDCYQLVSDDGLLLNGRQLIASSGTIPLNLSREPLFERMSRDAKKIVYEWNSWQIQNGGIPGADSGQPSLVFYDVDFGQETVLARGPVVTLQANSTVQSYFQPWMSDDGTLVSYLAAPSPGDPQQVFLVRTGGGMEVTQLTREPEGISNAVLAGSKNVVYATTRTNRIIQIQTASGEVREISGPLMTLSAVGVPGSLLPSQGFPPVYQVLSAQLAGIDVPVINMTPDSLGIQVPWDFPLADPTGLDFKFTASFNGQKPSLFDPVPTNIYAANPTFLRVPQPVVAHQDFRGVVTNSDPAVPGEIVHIYMTGLGPVSPAIPTGKAAPIDALYTAVTGPACSFFSYNIGLVPSEILFAGLAPNTVGIYQVDVGMPSQPAMTDWSFQCANHSGEDSIVIPTQH